MNMDIVMDSEMDTVMDARMEHGMESVMEGHPMGMTIDTVWSAENFTPANLSNLENALNASFNYPLAQVTSNATSDDSLSNTMYKIAGMFPDDSSPRSRYVSLDGGRPDSSFLLPLETDLANDVKESAKERRRTQNRFAQRAYRQRKEQAIKDQEKEIEDLKLQLAKEKKLNQALSKVIEFLKERLKTKQPEAESGSTSNADPAVATAPSSSGSTS